MPVVVGIDLSLTSTGFASVSTGPMPSIAVSRVTSSGTAKDSLAKRRERILAIANEVVHRVDMHGPALVVIEAPSFASKYGHPHDRSGLWWIVVSRLMQAYPLAQVPPKTRAKYATGNGNADKDQVLTDVVRRFPSVMVSKNDEADALALAAMGARHLGAPVEATPLTAAHLAAMDGAEWPTP